MKPSILLAVALGAASAAGAASLELPQWPLSGAHGTCKGWLSGADDSAAGTCRRWTAPACSGPGCPPVVYHTFYNTGWNKVGSLKTAVRCATTRDHWPQADQWSYALGYSAAYCANLNLATPAADATIYGIFYYATVRKKAPVLRAVRPALPPAAYGTAGGWS